jgi:hypothetical protein
MFIRRKPNKSGTYSIQVVSKHNGQYILEKSFGASSDEIQLKILEERASDWMARYGNQAVIDFADGKYLESTRLIAEGVLDNIDRILLNGPLLILNRIYDSIGFDRIEDSILRHLAIARVCQPMSKLATVGYLKSHFNEGVALHDIYRYMDKLHYAQRDLIQQISVEHTRKILGGRIGIVFYDVTTLYFETAKEDALRCPGFSKDGKTAESQVVLGLLVSMDGYPLSYSLFNGSQFEGRTMLPIVDDFVQRFSLTDFVVVSDAGLMSRTNIKLLKSAGYTFILGGRIKKEAGMVKDWLFSLESQDGAVYERKMDNGERIIVSYSAKRAAKDAFNRQRGIERLQKAYKSGKVSKKNINQRGYNKFLKVEKDVMVSIDYSKISEDAKWDGWKSYITNTECKPTEIIDQYRGLWVVERAFRVSKGVLEMRPMFHFTEKRIESHVCICFVAYKLYKELERIVTMLGIGMSVDAVIDIAKSIPTIEISLPDGQSIRRTVFNTSQQEAIKPLFPPEI